MNSIAMYQVPRVLADVVDGDDVRVREPAGRLRLAAEAGDRGLGVFAGELIARGSS